MVEGVLGAPPLWALLILCVNPRLDHLQVVVAEAVPEEVLNHLPGLGELILLKCTGALLYNGFPAYQSLRFSTERVFLN